MKVVIRGAGITGLATAWFLHQRYGARAEITLVEKSARVGGWISTIEKEGFLFERGPRGFRPHELTLSLVKELGLQTISASHTARKRYLWLDGRLQPFSLGFLVRKGALWALLKERRVPPMKAEDESIAAFFRRRFGPKLTACVIDPLVKGVFAGDAEKLSVRSCFPKLVENEKRFGTVVKRGKRPKGPPLLSFKEGMEVLPRALLAALPTRVRLQTEEAEGDHVIDCFACADVPKATITTVSLGYHTPVLKKRGYGYLIPSSEGEQVLGMTWDSEIFPEQAGVTRLCVMLPDVDNPLEIALDAARRHVSIEASPDVCDVHVARHAIPQREVGRVYRGQCCVGINECVAHAKKVAEILNDHSCAKLQE